MRWGAGEPFERSFVTLRVRSHVAPVDVEPGQKGDRPDFPEAAWNSSLFITVDPIGRCWPDDSRGWHLATPMKSCFLHASISSTSSPRGEIATEEGVDERKAPLLCAKLLLASSPLQPPPPPPSPSSAPLLSSSSFQWVSSWKSARRDAASAFKADREGSSTQKPGGLARPELPPLDSGSSARPSSSSSPSSSGCCSPPPRRRDRSCPPRRAGAAAVSLGPQGRRRDV